MVRGVTLILENTDGSQHPGVTSSEMDAQRFFDGTPALGPKFSKGLIARQVVPAHATEDHMVLASFDFPEAALQARRNFIVHLDEVDGKSFDLTEK
jgi:hypothetical protein